MSTNIFFEHKTIPNVVFGVLSGVVIWILLFLQTAAQLRGAPAGTKLATNIGPLTLNYLSKQTAEHGGYIVSFTFESGLIWYFIVTVIIALGIGFLKNRHKSPNGT